jgi:biopolymer transport protein ExbD
VVQIHITPLIDVLLVLLVLGGLAWSGSQVAAHTHVRATSSSDVLPGLSLPLRSPVEISADVPSPPDRLMIGLGVQGRLSWREVPVTRDILAHQLRTALEQDRLAEVWLAVDQAVPYADVLAWLEWLQAQQVTRLTLLNRSPLSAPVSGKP